MAAAKYRLATGKPRKLVGDRKAWTVKLDAPSPGYPSYRVHFKEENETGVWDWTSRSPEEHTDTEARKLFAHIEAWLDGVVDRAPQKARDAQTRTIADLVEAMLTYSKEVAKLEKRTVEGRESIGRAHVTATIGKVPVSKWRTEHTVKVLEAAARTCGTDRLSDIKTVMAVMRTVAHDNGWLDASVNPLLRVKLPKKATRHGAGKGYVPNDLRPERHMVDAVAGAADRLVEQGYQSFARFPLFGTQYRVAGYGGLRLGEQNGLRPWDVFFDRGIVEVNGSWVQPRATDGDPFRGPVKNRKVHDVPLPASLMRELLPRVKELLDLAADATMQHVLNAQRAERAQRARDATGNQAWFDVPVDPAQEKWLFVDNVTGLPARSETVNRYWHKVRRWVAANDAEHEWPKTITYRNMRHHAATFWHDTLGRGWVDVASFLGDELTTVLNHYVLPGADALKETVAELLTY